MRHVIRAIEDVRNGSGETKQIPRAGPGYTIYIAYLPDFRLSELYKSLAHRTDEGRLTSSTSTGYRLHSGTE